MNVDANVIKVQPLDTDTVYHQSSGSVNGKSPEEATNVVLTSGCPDTPHSLRPAPAATSPTTDSSHSSSLVSMSTAFPSFNCFHYMLACDWNYQRLFDKLIFILVVLYRLYLYLSLVVIPLLNAFAATIVISLVYYCGPSVEDGGQCPGWPHYREISDEWLHKLFLTLNHPIECGDSTQWLIRCPLPPLLPAPASPTLGYGNTNTGYLHCLLSTVYLSTLSTPLQHLFLSVRSWVGGCQC